MKPIKWLLIPVLFLAHQVIAQDSIQNKGTIDPTKPTNLYTQFNANLEYQSSKAQNLIGVRTNIQYAFNPDNLLLMELPFLYNDRTAAAGLGDMRVRYFNAIKRNISSSFIAIAPFADISLPTGSYKNGLGTSSWSLAGGVVLGFVLSKNLSLFPGISYVHITKQETDLIPVANKFSSNGLGLQFNASYVINKKTFLFINPIPSFLNTNGHWSDIWAAEFNLNRIVTPNKLKVNASLNPNFTYKIYTFRLGATLFL